MSGLPKIQHILPLTPMQEGLLFNYLNSPGSEAYFEQTSFQIHGDIDMEYVFHSFEIWIARHDVFRTLFIYQNVEKPKQIVLHQRRCNVFFNDLSTGDKADIATLIEAYQEQDRRRGFDLSRDMPIRLAVFRIDKKIYQFIFSFHHIILDGWSFGLLLGEFFEIYQKLLQNQEVNYDKEHSFRQYVLWLQKQNLDQAYAYWTDYLKDFEIPTKLPGEIKNRFSEASYNRKEKAFIFDSAVFQSIQDFIKDNQMTLNIFIQTLWGILLQRYNNTDDVVFGTVVSGRHAEIDNIDQTVGLLINTIPVRIGSSSDTTVASLFQTTQKQYAASSRYDYCSLSEIQSKAGFSGNLISHVLVFENYIKTDVVKAFIGNKQAFSFQISDVSIFEQTNYDFNLLVIPDECLQIRIIYNENVYSSKTVERILAHFQHTVCHVLKNSHCAVRDLDILPDFEKKQLLHDFQAKHEGTPPFNSIHTWFETQAECSCDRIAVCDESGKITYGELNARANQWAWYLKEQGIGPEVIVGVFMKRSIDLLVGLLAVLKAGGAYLPLDIKTPAARIQKIIRSSRMNCLLVQSSNTDKILSEIPILPIDQVQKVSAFSEENPPSVVQADHLMYVIYTSGSTGEPKGVMIEHGSFFKLTLFYSEFFRIHSSDIMTQVVSPAFDVFASEVWPCLSRGATLFIIPDSVRKDPLLLMKWLDDNQVTITYQSTAVAEILIKQAWPESTKLRLLCTAGDRLKNIPSSALPFCFYNLYGPTEDTVYTTYYEVIKHGNFHQAPPIGKPLPYHQVLILDDAMRLQPIGCVGELCIGGSGLARGYFSDPQKTDEKFVSHPLCKNEKLYKTGDLAVWNEEGQLEYIGRSDFQVKIGGHRIELGEIESFLMMLPGMHDCVATVFENDSDSVSLCCYFSADRIYHKNDIQSYLKKHLPHYMIPDYFYQLEELPYNTNGKIDRKRLPSPVHLSFENQEVRAPRNAVESMLCDHWKAILGMNTFSMDDDFFDCGGNSIKAIQLQARLSAKYHVQIQDIFEYPTIAQLAQRITYKPDHLNIAIQSMKDVLQNLDRESLKASLQSNLMQYQSRISNEVSRVLKKPDFPENILLTGATGFLGSYLLYHLLHETQANITCIIRGSDEKSITQRLKNRYAFYFNRGFDPQLMGRIKILKGDLGCDRFGLDPEQYDQIASDVDCIINAAANVKHFGSIETFFQPNVKGVFELIQLMKSGRSKILHHISTASVGLAYARCGQSILFTEYSEHEKLSYENPYIYSKIQAEDCIFRARKMGLDARIYRVGNLVFHSETGQFQANMDENAFYQVLRAFKLLEIVPDIPQLSFEFSPIDAVSDALVKLLLQRGFFQKTFHIYHPDPVESGELGVWFNQWDSNIRILPKKLFFNELLQRINHDQESMMIHAIIRYFQLLTQDDAVHCFPSNLKTNAILEKLDFHWPAIGSDHIFKMLRYGDHAEFW